MTRQASAIMAILFLAACGGAAPVSGGAKGAEDKRAAEASPEGQSTKPAPAQVTAGAAGPAASSTESSSPASPKPTSPQASATAAPIALPDLAESPGARELEAGAEAMRKKEWVTAQVKLEAGIASLGPEANADAHLVGRALLGRSFAMGKADARAEEAYRKVLELWKDPAMSFRIGMAGGDEGAQRARQGRALLAVAEAMYFFAEQKREAINKMYMPSYRGANNRAEVTRFVSTDVADFLKKKQVLIDEADKAYRAVIDLEGAPSPWVVRSLARMATMRGRLIAELRAAPIPEDWRRSRSVGPIGELREFYYASLDGAAAPLRAPTTAAYQTCKDQSERLGVNDDHARACRTWLEKVGGQAKP